MKVWNVYLEKWTLTPDGGESGGERLIDTVFYDSDCDAQYVHNGLVNHDGYTPSILVRCKETGEEYSEVRVG